MKARESTSWTKTILSGAAFAAMAYASVAQAQATAAPDDAGASGLQEIVVTAERRETTLQSTPIAVAAVSQDSMVRAGVNDPLTLNKLVPDLNITRSAAGFAIQLRGVFSQDTSPTSEAPNAIAIDNAPIVKNLALAGMQYDLQRVEVLKGPQGTLYGRNSTGGAINFVTNHPGFSPMASGELEFGSYNLLRTTGVVNVPLSDTFAVRGAFQTLFHKGYRASGLDDADEKSGRLQALWKPTDKDTLLFTADLTHIGGKGSGSQVPFGRLLAPAGNNKGLAYVIDPNPLNDQLVAGTAIPYHYNSVNRGLMVQYDHDFGFADLTVQVADRLFNSHPQTLGPLSNVKTSNVPGTGPAGGTSVAADPGYYDPSLPYAGVTDVWSKFHSDSIEARLTSTAKEPLQWVVGVNGLRDWDSGIQDQWPTQKQVYDTLLVTLYDNAKSAAVFGQATWTPPQVPKLHLTGGLRYTWDEKTGRTSTWIGTGTSPIQILAPLTDAHGSWKGTTSRLAINYDITDRVMIYGSRATGYKGGGIAYGPTPVYDPETNTAYEVGLKSRFLDNRLQVNVEAYTYDYKNIEVGLGYRVVPALNAVPVNVITVTNAGSEKMTGYAFDVQFLATSQDRISVNFSGERARYGTFIPKMPPYSPLGLPGTTNTLPIDLSHTPVPGVPQWAGRATYDHTFDVGEAKLDWQVATQFRGRTMMSAVNTNYPNAAFPTAPPEFRLYSKPWALFDTSIRYTPGSGKWSATAYVRNIGNKMVWQSAGANTTQGLLSASYFPPRTVGVIFNANF